MTPKLGFTFCAGCAPGYIGNMGTDDDEVNYHLCDGCRRDYTDNRETNLSEVARFR